MRRRQFLSALLVATLLTGCTGTRFKYQPAHAQSYAPVGNNHGVAIIRGEDLRIDTTHPDWSPKVEAIVADALADELKHSRIFRHVSLRNSMPKKGDKNYSRLITFRVQQFEYHDESNALESLGRAALRSERSGGTWMARSIPVKFIANVQIEFTVIDPASRQTVFTKSYAENESVRVNGYQGESQQIHATSRALEKVITRFTADLARLPLSGNAP